MINGTEERTQKEDLHKNNLLIFEKRNKERKKISLVNDDEVIGNPHVKDMIKI